MHIYIYKKTHVKTGLKYLGKTTQKDPHKYKGSGIRWLNHIKVHGYDVVTEILKICSSKEEAMHWGQYYSNLYNIVESDEWANLKPEIGDGGFSKRTSEMIAKHIATRQKNGTMNTNSPQSVAKALATKEKNNTLNNNTAESMAKKFATRMSNGTLWQDQKIITKIRDTKIKNGTLNSRTSDSIRKQKETISKTGNNNCKKNNPTHQKVTCEHCSKIVGLGMFARWHGVKCKLRPNICQ